MSAETPEPQWKMMQRERESIAEGRRLMEEDSEDPERGPIVRQIERVRHQARYGTPLFQELDAFSKAFLAHFGEQEARQYRLFHYIIGSGPRGTDLLFDVEGEWSIAAKIRELAERYQIDIEER